jgi:hypothetical protein
MTTKLLPSVHNAGDKKSVSSGPKSKASKIASSAYYEEYHGHLINHLSVVHSSLKTSPERACCFLVGDSSMDNKYWLGGESAAAINGYENVLTKKMVKDVSYWVNKSLVDKGVGKDFFCINASVEESTLGIRQGGALLEQDEFVRDHIQTSDVIICSVGGNDIALRPTLGTIINIATLLMQPQSWIESNWAIGLGHFYSLWKESTEEYIRSLCTKHKPKVVVICMIYYLNETPGNSWADGTLSKLGYNSDPSKLQAIIRTIFREATCKIEIEGTTVVPFPMFEILDGKHPGDYKERVEPSVQGGEKLGKAMVDAILAAYPMCEKEVRSATL